MRPRRLPGAQALTRAAAGLLVGALATLWLGCSSNMPVLSSGRVPATLSPDRLAAPAAGLDGTDPSRRVVRIEPDPQRDEEVHSLLRAALDGLRSGEIQPALDLLMQAQSIEGWTQSEHAPAVLFWTGHSYDQLGERFAAMGAFRRITIQYPRSAFAERATRRLRELRSRSPQASGPQR